MRNMSARANVLHAWNDSRPACSQNANMPRRPPKQRDPEQYEAYKEASGWYLAAWRDFRGLTLEELAEAYGEGTSRGRISDFETGALRSNGRTAATINPQALRDFARVLGTTPGRLIDVNPFAVDERFTLVEEAFPRLDPRDQETVTELVRNLLKRSA